MSVSRQMVVDTALRWEKTPYHHQASVRGVGADCLGFLRGVYRELYGREPEVPPPYAASWGESDGQELLLGAAYRHLWAVDYDGWKLGDVLVFRVRNAKSAKHCGIVIGDNLMLHAVSGKRGGVIQTSIGEWGQRVAGVFQFPTEVA